MKVKSYLCTMKCRGEREIFLWGILILFLSPLHGYAQEYVKSLYQAKNDTSIVRNIDTIQKLMYVGYNEFGGFSSFNNNSTSTVNMYLGSNMIVRDFEIDRSMVYFCGHEILDNGSCVAVLGLFDLSLFPASPVYYYRHMEYVSFEQLDFYKIRTDDSTQLHVVLGAFDTNGKTWIIDSYEISFNRWLFWYLFPYDSEKHIVRDIEVTPNHVMVTTDRVYNSKYSGYLWYFERPGYIDGTIFDVRVCKMLLHGTSAAAARLEQCENNYFAVAYTYMQNKVQLMSFNGYGNLYNLQFTELSPSLKDIRYNKNSRELDMLLSKNNSFFYNVNSNVFYHFPQSVSSSGGNVTGHQYSIHKIHSFDYDGSDTYIATGDESGMPMMYHYKYSQWDSCFNEVSCEAVPFYFEDEPKNVIHDKGERYYIRRVMNCNTGSTLIDPVCVHRGEPKNK